MTSALARLEERIEALEAAAEAIKDETRAAHEATKALRAVQKDIEHLLTTEVRAIVDAAIAEQVRKGLEGYQATIKTQTEKATQAVFRRFEDLFNTLTTGRRSGDGPVLGSEDWRLRNGR